MNVNGAPSPARKSAPRVNHKLRFHAPMVRPTSPERKPTRRRMSYHSSIDPRAPELPPLSVELAHIRCGPTNLFRAGGTA